ncbi:MAG: hypothetical protein LBJ67_14735 [Planctomycetaceae bacterium]|jgi:hypothetical protein|nr:hypothetical protein [Planctomycetaceae bacterium]
MIGLPNKTNEWRYHDVNPMNKIKIILKRFACGCKNLNNNRFAQRNIGIKESESNTVALRSRKDGELGEINVGEVIGKLAEEISMRTL